jgi:hypothetical protein
VPDVRRCGRRRSKLTSAGERGGRLAAVLDVDDVVVAIAGDHDVVVTQDLRRTREDLDRVRRLDPGGLADRPVRVRGHG